MGQLTAAAAAFVTVVLITTTMIGAEGERINKTSSSNGIFWSAANEEADSASGIVNDLEDRQLDGGVSTLDGMLQWAIGHSDPQKLKEVAQRLSPTELKNRQLEIRQLVDELRMPSDAQLMKVAITDLNNSSLSLEDHHRALQELLILVEPIDNANDLSKLGGIGVLIQDLNHPDSDVRRMSAWVLGKASQNNPVVQRHILEMGALGKLMHMVNSNSVEEGIKAFYAISALIRNNLSSQELFYAEAGDQMLQDILSNSSTDIRLRRKAVNLVADLAEYQLESVGRDELAFFSNQLFLKSVIDLTSLIDLDLQEKALVAIKNLLQLKTTEALIVKDFCGLDGALERMRQQLLDLMAVENHRDYAMDIEKLRLEVELMFRSKTGKVTK
ncbi:hsp70 nucleotide exchange factor FES1 [Mercurialis annua]|uniref:hsp70 nucleotide exchange factor FES1 n=1 Tax=Mercurialis annua TaxID=3986 RepID=UPI00215FA284|nr:hsp70 nucleotide exchange factor FES1 [Mercurialis annua]